MRVALGGEARVAPPAQLFVRPEADVREDAVGAQVGAGGGVGGINGAMGGDVQGGEGLDVDALRRVVHPSACGGKQVSTIVCVLLG